MSCSAAVRPTAARGTARVALAAPVAVPTADASKVRSGRPPICGENVSATLAIDGTVPPVAAWKLAATIVCASAVSITGPAPQSTPRSSVSAAAEVLGGSISIAQVLEPESCGTQSLVRQPLFPPLPVLDCVALSAEPAQAPAPIA